VIREQRLLKEISEQVLVRYQTLNLLYQLGKVRCHRVSLDYSILIEDFFVIIIAPIDGNTSTHDNFSVQYPDVTVFSGQMLNTKFEMYFALVMLYALIIVTHARWAFDLDTVLNTQVIKGASPMEMIGTCTHARGQSSLVQISRRKRDAAVILDKLIRKTIVPSIEIVTP